MILYYLGVCCYSVSCILYVFREAKLNLLSCVNSSSDSNFKSWAYICSQGENSASTRPCLNICQERTYCFTTTVARLLYLKAKHQLLSNLIVRITSKCSHFSADLMIQLNWKLLVDLGVTYCQDSIQGNYSFFYGYLLTH